MIQWDVDLVNIAVFSLPITTVTKSLGLAVWRWRQRVGVRVVSGVVGQGGLHCKNIYIIYTYIYVLL